jgi:hypothetical protein
MGSGRTHLKGKYDPYAKQPTFDLAFQLNNLALKQTNEFLRAYANLDVERGTLSLDGEFEAARGRFRGYAKPFIKDLDVLRSNEDESFVNKLWQGVAEVAASILEDSDTDRIATRIPFSGVIEDPAADIWSTIGGLLKNAFIEALRRGIEGGVDVGASAANAKNTQSSK